MNIVKVNAVLAKALSQIQEGENEGLRELVVSEEALDGDEPTEFEEAVGAIVDKLVGEYKLEDKEVITAIVDVAGEMADNGALPEIFGLDNPTEEDVKAWISAVEESDLVEQTILHLTS